jgi:hypothetical protein
VAAPVGPVDVEGTREVSEVGLEDARVGAPRMQEHERLAGAVLLVVRVHLAELCVCGHVDFLYHRDRIGRRG